MKQITMQMLYGAGNKHLIVGCISSHTCFVSPNETKFRVGIPIPMGDPATQKPNFTVEPASVKPINITAFEKCEDRLPEFRRDLLIRVEYKHPGLRASVKGYLFLSTVSEPILPDHATPFSLRDGSGSIG
jgi:hypothetical protein